MASAAASIGGVLGTPGQPCIARSNLDYEACLDSLRLRHLYPDFCLNVSFSSKCEDIFGPAWAYTHDKEYSNRLIYHLSAHNHLCVSAFAEQRFKGSESTFHETFESVWKQPRDVFSQSDLEHYGHVFLQKVLDYCRLSFNKLIQVQKTDGQGKKPNLRSQSTPASPAKAQKHRKSKSQTSLSVIIPVSSPVQHEHLAAPATNRHVFSDEPVLKPTMGDGERTVSGPNLDPHVTNVTPVVPRHSVPSTPSVRTGRPLPHFGRHLNFRMHSPQLPSPAMLPPQPIMVHRVAVSPGFPQVQTSRFHPPTKPSRVHAGEIFGHNQLPEKGYQLYGGIQTHHIAQAPHHPGHHTHSAPGANHPSLLSTIMTPMPPPGLPSPIGQMQPVLPDIGFHLRGIHPILSQDHTIYPGVGPSRHINLQTPGTQAQGLSMNPGYGKHGIHPQDFYGRTPRQQAQIYGTMRGIRPRKNSGRNSVPNFGSRRNSAGAFVERPLNTIPNKPSAITQLPMDMPAPRRQQESSTQENHIPGSQSRELERFPDFIDNTLAANLALPEGERCYKKFIGPDAEDVTTLWVGNISKGTSEQDLKALLEKEVPVARIREFDFDNRALAWTFIDFYKSSDARTALTLFDGTVLNESALDVQVPERRRCDLSKLSRRSSGSRYGGWQGRDNGQSSFSSTRPPFGRSNSTRKFRTNSNTQSEAVAHRNSIFTPQDARSDLPEVPEVPETPKDDSQRTSKVKQKRKESQAPSNYEHPIAEPILSSIQDALSEIPAREVVPSNTSPHNFSNDSCSNVDASELHTLRRTSHGLEYEFDFIPSSQDDPETAAGRALVQKEDRPHPTNGKGEARDNQVGKSNSSMGQSTGSASPVLMSFTFSDGQAESTEQLEKEDVSTPTFDVSLNSLHAEISSNHPGNMPAPATTTFQKEISTSVDSGYVVELTESTVVTHDSSITQTDTAVDCSLELSQLRDDSVQLYTSGAIEADPELSVAPEENNSIFLTDQKPVKTETGSIHPFARQKREQRRQVSKTEKKKQKKEKQATKKKTDTVASVASEQSEHEILPAQGLVDISKNGSSAAKHTKAKVEWNVLSTNVHDLTPPDHLSMKGSSVSIAPALEQVMSNQVNSFGPDQSSEIRPNGWGRKTVTARFEKLSSSGVPKLPPMLKVPAPPAVPLPMQKRAISATRKSSIHITGRALSVASSNADVASDDSSPMATPHTAKEFQTPAPSPLPSSRPDSPSALTQLVGAGEPGNSADTNTVKKGRKRKKRNNKKISVDKSNDFTFVEEPKEAPPQHEITVDDRARSRSCSGENKETQYDQQSNIASQDGNSEAKKSVDAGTEDKQDTNAETKTQKPLASGKENAPKMSYAQMARATPNSPATISLTPRSPNILSSQKIWD